MLKITLSQKILKELKFLKKKFRNIEKGLDDIFKKLAKSFVLGGRLKDFKNFEFYKVRLKNSSSSTGSRGILRIIYLLKKENNEILALTIYSETIKTDISKKEILQILKSENLV